MYNSLIDLRMKSPVSFSGQCELIEDKELQISLSEKTEHELLSKPVRI